MITPVTDEDLNDLEHAVADHKMVAVTSTLVNQFVAELRALRAVAEAAASYRNAWAGRRGGSEEWNTMCAALRDAGRLP